MKKYNLEKIHIFHEISFKSDKEIQLNPREIPHQHPSGVLIDTRGSSFAKIEYKTTFFEGGYGVLYKCVRKDISSNILQTAIVKSPLNDSTNLDGEALIQWLAWNTMKEYGLQSAIPEVYDIFVRKNRICFSMEYIDGDFPHTVLAESKNPDLFFFQMLTQIALLCLLLEKNILLDHRDLKANNVYIRNIPIHYSFQFAGFRYSLKAPFQVVILDFGFSCLGNSKGTSAINLGEAQLPQSDPCPKEGRDLFHFVTSFWSIPSIRNSMKKETQIEIDSLLIDEQHNYNKLTRNHSQIDWVYVLTGDSKFRFPQLAPCNLIQTLSERHPDILQKSAV